LNAELKADFDEENSKHNPRQTKVAILILMDLMALKKIA